MTQVTENEIKPGYCVRMGELQLETWQIILLLLALVWDLSWRGFALWHAARHDRQNWFIALIVINSVGILPIIYLLLNRTIHPQPVDELEPQS